MKIIAIVFLIYIVYADPKIDLFNKLQQSEFGQTILAGIKVQDNNTERVLEFLKQLQIEISDSQDEHSQYISNRNAQILQYIQEAEKAFKKATAQKALDESQVLIQQQEIDFVQQKITQKTEEQQLNEQKAQIIVDQRQQDKKAYEDRRSELVGLLSALNQGSKLLGQVKNGQTLFTQQEVWAQIDQHHKNFVRKFPQRRGFNSLISLSLSIAQDPALKSDQTAMERLISVLEDLKDSLFQLQKQEMEADDAKEQQFTKDKSRYDLQIQQLEAEISQLTANFLKSQQKLIEIQNDINTQQQIAENKRNEKADWQSLSRDETQSYGEQTQTRKEQLNILNETEQAFQSPLTSDQSAFLQKIIIKQ